MMDVTLVHDDDVSLDVTRTIRCIIIIIISLTRVVTLMMMLMLVMILKTANKIK